MEERLEESIGFDGVVDDKGHVKPNHVNAVRGRLARWKGRRVSVVVTRYIKSKSNAQLALFHGPMLVAASEYHGYPLKEMKFEFKLAYLVPFLPRDRCYFVSKLTGEEVFVMPSLADLNAEEMGDFLTRVKAHCDKYDIELGLDPASSG